MSVSRILMEMMLDRWGAEREMRGKVMMKASLL